MKSNHFYFISPKYFTDFPVSTIMGNHPSVSGQPHNRPCYFAFTNDSAIFWVIPISSKVPKFKKIYSDKVKKYGKCDTIEFSFVLGHEKAFLIQNMCPVTSEYILNEYLDIQGNSVNIDNRDAKRIITKAKKILELQKKGYPLIFGDVLSIEKKLSEKEKLNV